MSFQIDNSDEYFENCYRLENKSYFVIYIIIYILFYASYVITEKVDL